MPIASAKTHTFCTNANNMTYFNNMITHLNAELTPHLNRDIKEGMQLLGRSRFDNTTAHIRRQAVE